VVGGNQFTITVSDGVTSVTSAAFTIVGAWRDGVVCDDVLCDFHVGFSEQNECNLLGSVWTSLRCNVVLWV